MGQISVIYDAGGIKGLCVITPAVHGDSRGFFMETYSRRDMEEAGLHYSFVQDCQSLSKKGVLRGLHFQKRFPQAKLVRAIRGAVYDVAVDLRGGSPTYGKYHGEMLTAENKKQLLIPRGFAHGFLVLSEEAEYCYKCDDFYYAEDESGVAWNDPDIGIDWPRVVGADSAAPAMADGSPLILSERDRKWPRLKDAEIRWDAIAGKPLEVEKKT